ncbi:MAG: ATP-binding protein [bacterium]|nr:ATP-binding protein [bacterium]
MLLDNYPEEAERLRKHEKFFEWVTWLIIIVSYAIGFLPLGLPIHRAGMNLVFAVVSLTTLITYRLFPFEKRTGLLKYTYKLKGFQIQISDHIFASVVILFSGGINSPFWFIYLLALIAGAMYLPAWAMIVAGIEAIGLYLLTVAFLTPFIFGYYDIGLTAQMLIVPMAAVFAVIMTYVVAKDLNIEIVNIRNLANILRKKTLEITGERNKLNAVVTSVTDGIFVLDRQRRFIFINKAALNILGKTEQELLNKDFDSVIFAREAQSNQSVGSAQICTLDEIEDDKIIYGPRDLKIKDKAVSEKWIRLTSTQIREGQSLDIGCICTFHDIGKEKELEEMKLDFVAMAAHELRTPLTAIRGYLSVLIEEVSKKLTKEERSWVEKAFISSTNLAALVENLLSVSRIELQSLKLDMVKVDWQKVLQEVVTNFQPAATQKGLDFKSTVKEKLPEIAVDKFRINEVLSNLIGNAISYTNPGGKVEISSWFEDGNIITSVKDSGEGIPQPALPHLFTKFFRVSGVLEQGSKGTGLGLYISKAIIDMHQGKIWVKSKLGVGSTFTFSLPLKQRKISPKKPLKKATLA